MAVYDKIQRSLLGKCCMPSRGAVLTQAIQSVGGKIIHVYSFADGFETGDFSKWDGKVNEWVYNGYPSPAVITTYPHSDTYCMRVIAPASPPNHVGVYKAFADLREITADFWFRYSTRVTGISNYWEAGMMLNNGVIVQGVQFRFASDTQDQIYYGLYHDGAYDEDFVTGDLEPVFLNSWVHVKSYYKRGVGNGILKVWINDDLRVDQTALNTSEPVNRFNTTAKIVAGVVGTSRLDDIALSGIGA